MKSGKLAFSILTLAALTAVGASYTHHRATTRERAAMAAYPPEGQFLTVDGVQMHAVVQGSGPDLVLIHGSSGSVRDFTFGLTAQLARRYRVISIDRPGLGWSAPAPGGESLATQARLLRATAAQLGAERPIVLGQSYGGSVALAWALQAPQDIAALVLLATPSHPWDSGLSRFYKVTSHPLGARLVVPLLTAFVPREKVMREVESVFAPQTAPEGYADHFGPGMTLRRLSLRANARQRAALKDEILTMVPRYPGLEMPAELVHGTADTTVGLSIHAEKLLADMPNAVLTRLPGIGHMPHHSAPDQVIAAIDRAAIRAGLR